MEAGDTSIVDNRPAGSKIAISLGKFLCQKSHSGIAARQVYWMLKNITNPISFDLSIRKCFEIDNSYNKAPDLICINRKRLLS